MFVIDKRNKDGTANFCKACRNAGRRKRGHAPKRYIGKRKQECSKCAVVKPLEKFQRDAATRNGRKSKCKDCCVSNKPFKAFGRLKEKQKLYVIPIEITKEEVAMIFEAFEGECIYCGVKESKETGTMNLEHIVPMKRGGRHHVSNFVISCGKCNAKKHDKPLITFYRSHEQFRGDRLDYIFKHVAYFTNRDPEEVAKEFYAEVNDE